VWLGRSDTSILAGEGRKTAFDRPGQGQFPLHRAADHTFAQYGEASDHRLALVGRYTGAS
jgi:hypothetical protein